VSSFRKLIGYIPGTVSIQPMNSSSATYQRPRKQRTSPNMLIYLVF